MTTPGSFRLRRVSIASLVLLANLIAVGIPVLHALTHRTGHGHDRVVDARAVADHEHDEIHPLELHQECLLVHRTGSEIGVALPSARFELAAAPVAAAPMIYTVVPVASRAPPGEEQARAPPLV